MFIRPYVVPPFARFVAVVVLASIVGNPSVAAAEEGDHDSPSNDSTWSSDLASHLDSADDDVADDDECFGHGGVLGFLSRFPTELSDAGRKSLADKHAPAGIMGDHVHERGEIMAEYKYMNMYMQGNRSGTTNLTAQQALTVGQSLGTNNAATPTKMNMEMHMLHMMYGLTDDVTLYIMPTWNSLTMDHLRNTPFGPNPPLAGTPFTTHNSGFSDLPMGALWQFNEGPCHQWIFNFCFSVPTGDIDRTTTVPTGGLVAQEFPYPMRLGSGTFDFRPGITFKRFFSHGSFGAQFQTDLPVGRNDENYRVGEQLRLNAWYAHLLTDWLAISYRVEGLWRENYDGADSNLPGGIISTNRPDMRGGEWLNFGYGVMALLCEGHLLNFEAVHPVYQDLDGIQLETDWTLFMSWSKAF